MCPELGRGYSPWPAQEWVSPDSCSGSVPDTPGSSGCMCWPHELLLMELQFITENKKVKDI